VGSRGPVANPNLYAVNGGADHRKARGTPAKLAPYNPTEPDWKQIFGKNLPARKDASAHWQWVVPQLLELGQLARIDIPTVTDCCLVYARLRQCERELSERGLLVDSERGLAKNPVTTVLNQYRGAYQRYMTDLGLSPMARLRLGATEPEAPADDSDLDDPEG
jgi:P27 family predicted phage terminase small subunit